MGNFLAHHDGCWSISGSLGVTSRSRDSRTGRLRHPLIFFCVATVGREGQAFVHFTAWVLRLEST